MASLGIPAVITFSLDISSSRMKKSLQFSVVSLLDDTTVSNPLVALKIVHQMISENRLEGIQLVFFRSKYHF
jgi:hypothetical protein